MLTTALVAAAMTFVPFIAPAAGLQLFVRRCYAGTGTPEPESDAALSQRRVMPSTV